MATLNKNTSVVDLLKSQGKDASFASRSTLAAKHGITNYTGSSAQNLQLMSFIQGGGDTKKGLDTIINSDQKTVAETVRGQDAPPVRVKATDRYKTAADIVGKDAAKAPEAPNFEAEYAKLRKQYGVTDMESQLSKLTLQARTIEATRRQRVGIEEGKPVAMNVIEGRVGEVERQENERLDVVLRETEYYSNQVKNAYGVIDSIMKLKDMDYDNAKERYDSEFDRTMKVLQYGQDVEDKELSREQQARDNARANLQIIYNNLTEGTTDLKLLPPADLAMISKLEVQSGLPQGFISTLRSSKPNTEIVSSSTRQDASGAKYTDVVLRDRDGKMSVQSLYLGKERLPATGGGSTRRPTEGEIERSARSKASAMLDAVTGPDGYVDPYVYRDVRAAWANQGYSRADFDEEYKSLVNPASRRMLNLSY